MKKWIAIVIVMVLLFPFLFELPAQDSKPQDRIKMATTTSTENSGLLDVLLPAFEKRYGIRVYAIAVGTGKALKLAENGDVDLVLVHAPEMEKEFVKKGFGINRTGVFYNDFVVVGPKEDPAQVKSLKKVADVFKKIARGKFMFISRGDNSGTHKKELDIWNQANISPQSLWYLETGQGMGTTLNIANEKKGYCLVDRGTFISFEDKVELVIISEGDPFLKNPYSVIAVNPARHSHVRYKEARIFIDWLASEEGKNLINGFRKNEKILFHSAFLKHLPVSCLTNFIGDFL